MADFTQKTWVDVPDEANPPVGAVATEAAEFNRLEQGIADAIDHVNAVYAVHGGLVWYVAASGTPPTLPPTGLPWYRTDTSEAVVNTGTPSVPVWSAAFLDTSKLTAADLVTDYVVSGLLPSIPTNSLTLSVPSGVAYASGRRVSKATTNQTVPGRKATLVDLSYLGVFSNVDYGILLDDTEDAWLEKTDADFTQSVVAGPTGQGNAVRFVIAAGASAGDSVSEAIPIADLTPYGKIVVWVRSSVATTAGQLQLLLDNTAQVASPVHTLNIPALSANAWTLCEIAYDNTQVGTGSIISIGLKYTVDIGAATVDICKPYALKATEPAVSANSLRLFEARADADIAQVELVDITAAVNSTAYTVRINGVDIVYTSDASATEGEIALGLVAALNASVDPAVTPITASTTAIAGDASATLTITADAAGTPFTILVGANLSSANQVPSSTSSVIEVVDRRDLDPTLRGDVLSQGEADVLYEPLGATVSGTPDWVAQTSNAIFGAMGDGNPYPLWQTAMLSVNQLTPTNIGVTVIRLMKFRLPKQLIVNHVHIPALGSTTAIAFAIYRASDGVRMWTNTPSLSAGWVDVTTGTPFTLAADTDYWMAFVATGTSATACLMAVPTNTNFMARSETTSPIVGKGIGIPELAQAATTGGALPDPLGTVATPSAWTNLHTFIFLQGTAS